MASATSSPTPNTLDPWFTQTDIPHISFSAHNRSVITTLLLTGDRIITASDDQSISVFSALTGEQIYSLSGHEGGVWSIVDFEDTLVSGSTDRTIRVWDLNTGRCTHVFTGHQSTVRAVVVAKPEVVEVEGYNGLPITQVWPKVPMIVTGSRDHTLRVWTLPRPGDPEYKSSIEDSDDLGPVELKKHIDNNPFHKFLLEGHDHAVRAVATKGRIIASGSYDNNVRIWDIITGSCKHILRGHTGKVYAVTIDPTRPQIYSGSMDHTARIWDSRTGECIHVLEGHTSLIGLLSVSSTYLVTAAADSTIRVWNPDTGELYHVLSKHRGAVTCLQHDDTKAISGSDGRMILWDLKNGTAVRSMGENVIGVWQVAFDERRCVAAVNIRNDMTAVQVWDFGVNPEPRSPNAPDEVIKDGKEKVADIHVPGGGQTTLPAELEEGLADTQILAGGEENISSVEPEEELDDTQIPYDEETIPLTELEDEFADFQTPSGEQTVLPTVPEEEEVHEAANDSFERIEIGQPVDDGHAVAASQALDDHDLEWETVDRSEAIETP